MIERQPGRESKSTPIRSASSSRHRDIKSVDERRGGQRGGWSDNASTLGTGHRVGNNMAGGKPNLHNHRSRSHDPSDAHVHRHAAIDRLLAFFLARPRQHLRCHLTTVTIINTPKPSTLKCRDEQTRQKKDWQCRIALEKKDDCNNSLDALCSLRPVPLGGAWPPVHSFGTHFR